MTVTDFEITSVVDRAADFDLACEFSDDEFCPKFPAKWIGFARCEDCGNSGHVFICAACKDLVIHTEDSFECARCEAVHTPARRMFTRFEHFQRGSS